MTKAIVVRIEGDYVITAQGADLLSAIASQASDARDEAVSAAAAALAAAGAGEYPDTGAGLSGTTEGETFWVDLGDGTGQVYRHDPGPTATPLQKFIIDQTDSGAADIFAGGVPTTAALASSTGADMVGLGQGTLAQAIRFITPEQYGALGAPADDTAAINAWAAALGDGVWGIASGNYKISSRIELIDKTIFMVYGGGRFTIADGTATNETYSAFLIQNCTDFSIEDLTVDGNRAGRTPAESSGHLLRIIGGANGLFKNLLVRNGTTDGIYLRAQTPATLATYPTDMVFENCVVENCYRNNMSLISAVRPVVRGGSYRNANGTAPQAGIGIEPNSTDTYGVTGALIDFPDCSGNAGYGFYAGGASTDNVSGCIFRVKGAGNGLGLCELGRVNGLDVMVRAGAHSGTLASSQALLYCGSATKNVAIDFEAKGITCTGGNCIRVEGAATGITINRALVDTSSIPVLSCSGAGSVIHNVTGRDISANSAAVIIIGARTVLRGIDLRRCASYGLRLSGAANSLVDGVYLEDCASTVASLFTETGAGHILRKISVHQTTAVPGGAAAVRFDVAPSEVGGLTASGGYTASNLITMSGGATLAATKLYGLSPDPLSTSPSLTPGAGTVNAGAVATISTTNISRASVGDKVLFNPPTNLPAGLVALRGYCDTAGTVKIDVMNVTGSNITSIPAGNWQIWLAKA